jgi:cytochrome c oxidase accessory protein FixG
MRVTDSTLRSDSVTARSLTSPEVEKSDAVAVNKKEKRSLYAKHRKIYPKRAHGPFRRLKWIVMAITLSIYYLAPWLRWDRGPNLPDQAILIDFPGRRFYFFFIEIWPEEVYFITGLLILAALALFLFTSLAGRVWCGYSCPQTVWTDLYIAVERWIEGDRNQRMKLDQAPWTLGKAGKKLLKHVIWLLIGVATGGAWVFYFADAPTLAGQLIDFAAPTTAYVFMGLFTLTTYTLGGFAREQVCTYMCPWPRIQGALQDEDTLIVTYHPARGEPRGPHKKGQAWGDSGHCVDCNQCVAVCPMGIDIRDGQQMECISCALCIDACNGVMDKLGLPHNLIGYDTLAGLEHDGKGERPRVRLFRPRTILYAIAILIVGVVMLVALLQRETLDISVARDRNPLFVVLSDGSVRNGYTVHIENKHHDARKFVLTVDAAPGAKLNVVGQDQNGGASAMVTVPADQLSSFRVFVTMPPSWLPTRKSHHLRFILTDQASGDTAEYNSSFRGPDHEH